jgi:hypothetical protein
MQLIEFRVVPSPALADSVLRGEASVERVAGKDLLRVARDKSGDAGGTEYILDPSTGACLHLLRRAANGDIATETIQGGFDTSNQGILFPHFSVHASYRGNLMTGLTVVRLLSARFNDPVDASQFVMPTAKHDVIVNHTQGTADSARPFRLDRPAADARKVVVTPRTSVRPNETALTRSALPAVVIVNVLVLSLIVLLMWYRRRKQGR